MFERFTDRARKVLALANQEAQRFNHEYVGTEHILLGLVKEGSGVGAHVLKNLNIDLKKTRMEVEKLVKSGPAMVTMGKLPQTPRARKVIEYAMEEARALNHNHVGTEHILLGLLRESESVAAITLTNLGLNLKEVRAEVIELVSPTGDKTEGITVNVYKDGRVKSLQIDPDTSVGLFLPGEYTFTSERKERVVLVQGNAEVNLGSGWLAVSVEHSKSFNVAENSQFTLKCDAPVAYVCHYG